VFLQESGRGSSGIERFNDDVMVPDLPNSEKSALIEDRSGWQDFLR
jgi:hypothetical protein